MSYSIIAAEGDSKLIRTHYSGGVDMSDMRNAIQAVLLMVGNSDATMYNILTDFTRVESWRATTQELEELGRVLIPPGPSIRIARSALVAPQNHICRDLRAWVSETESLPFPRLIFRNMDAAMRWLDEPFDPVA